MYRFGGVEFVVLAAHTTANGAHQLAERIRQNIDNIATIRGRSVDITVSVGVATLQAGEEPRTFFDRADNALYSAKENGRNCVVEA